jgi:hypothetical protein
MKHIEKIVAEFDKTWCWSARLGKTDIYAIHPEIADDIKDFLRSSHTSFIQDLIQRVEGERKETPYKENHTIGDEVVWTFEDGKNSALDTIIKMLKEEIE